MIDPTQAGAQPPATAQPGAQQGVTVCITALPDGTFTVGPDADDQGGDPAAGAQPAQDIDSALNIARQMLGGAQQDPAAADAQADDLFQSGFNGANPRASRG